MKQNNKFLFCSLEGSKALLDEMCALTGAYRGPIGLHIHGYTGRPSGDFWGLSYMFKTLGPKCFRPNIGAAGYDLEPHQDLLG